MSQVSRLPRLFPSRRMIVSVEKDAWAYECPVTKVVVATSEPSADIRARLGRPTSSVALTCCRSGSSVDTPYVWHHAALGGHADPGVGGGVRALAADVEDRPRSRRVVQRDGGEPAVVGPERAVAEHDVRCGQHALTGPQSRGRRRRRSGRRWWTGRRRSSRSPSPDTTTPVTTIATSLPARHAATRRAPRGSAAGTRRPRRGRRPAPTPITQSASVRPTSCHIRPKPTERDEAARATTVCAAAMPLARLSSGTVWLASAESTPSVAA